MLLLKDFTSHLVCVHVGNLKGFSFLGIVSSVESQSGVG